MEELINKIKVWAQVENVRAVYMVGLNDESELSDLDLVVVNDKKPLSDIRKLDSRIDLRRLVNAKDFEENYNFWAYAEMTLIYGQELRVKIDDSLDLKIIKMAGMFFTSFLRNYYRHTLSKEINIKQFLKDLNDFNYCPKYLANIPDNLSDFIVKINQFRSSSNCSQVEARELLAQAIDCSWGLLEILDEKINKLFIIKSNKKIFFGKEITIFLNNKVDCRKKTEANIFGLLFKILFLPSSFSFMFIDSYKSFNYYNLNLRWRNIGFWGGLKMFIKKIAAIFIYLFNS